jgi:integrase
LPRGAVPTWNPARARGGSRKERLMPDDRVHVWVQRFKDRKHLMLQWLDPDTGKRKSKSAETDDEDKAEQARADLEYELNHGKYQEASRMTWERFRELFEQEYAAGTRLNTQENFWSALDAFERVCNPRTLRGISERTISLFVAGLRKEPGRRRGSVGMMPSTIKVKLQFLHTALSWAVEQKMLAAVPKFPTVKVPKKDPQPVPAESFERVLQKAKDEQMRAFLLCGWLAGLRLEEGISLEWEETDEAPWVDLARDQIRLPAGFVKAAEDQWVPLDPALKEALMALPRHGKKVFRFTTRKGRPIRPGQVGRRVIDLARAAGVRLTMRTLRRGFGCRYASRVPAQVLQKLMRHSDIKITMTYYANVDDAAMQAILGAGCNTPRNTLPPRDNVPGVAHDVTPRQ